MSLHNFFLSKNSYIPAPPLPLWSSFSEIAERLHSQAVLNKVFKAKTAFCSFFGLCVCFSRHYPFYGHASVRFSSLHSMKLPWFSVLTSLPALPQLILTFTHHSHLLITPTCSNTSCLAPETYSCSGFLLQLLNTFSPFPLLFHSDWLWSSVIGPVHFQLPSLCR